MKKSKQTFDDGEVIFREGDPSDTAYEIVNSPGRRLTAGEAFRGRTDGAAPSVTLNVFDGLKKYADLREAEAIKSGAGCIHRRRLARGCAGVEHPGHVAVRRRLEPPMELVA